MPYVLLKESITLSGSHIDAGEYVDLSEKSANALIEEGKASHAEPFEETRKSPEVHKEPSEGDKDESVQTPSEGQENEAGAENEAEKITKALNDQYSRTKLAEEAKKVGVEFPYDAKKGEIVRAVIEQGKAEALLK